MSDPTADQIGQIAQNQPQPVSESELAAQAPSGIGVTEADIDAIKAQLADFAAQLRASQLSASANPDALTGSVDTLVHHLGAHGDPAAIALGADAAEAVKAAAEGGNTGALSGIIKKISEHLRRNRPYPGENFHYNSAVSVADHLPVQIDRINESQQAPDKVVSGSVVG